MSISLKPSALKEAIQRSSVVLFYAPWCGHCERFMPQYDAFSAQASTALPDLVVAKINYDKYGPDVQKQNIGSHLVAGGVSKYIKGFPTVAFFHDNRMSIYKGERTSEALMNSVKEFIAEVRSTKEQSEEEMFQNKELLSIDEPARGEVAAMDISPTELKTIIQKPAMVMMYAPWCGHCKRSMSTMDSVATALSPNNIQVAKLDYEKYGKEVVAQKIGYDLLKNQGFSNGIASAVKGFPTILMFSGKDVAQYTGPRETNTMVDAMNEFAERYQQ